MMAGCLNRRSHLIDGRFSAAGKRFCQLLYIRLQTGQVVHHILRMSEASCLVDAILFLL